MLQQIKIMLGLESGEKNHEACNNYDSFVEDVKSSSNKTGPNLDDHNLIARIAKLLRAGSVAAVDAPDQEVEATRSEGFIEKMRRKLGKHE